MFREVQIVGPVNRKTKRAMQVSLDGKPTVRSKAVDAGSRYRPDAPVSGRYPPYPVVKSVRNIEVSTCVNGVPEVLQYLADQLGMPPSEAYSTLYLFPIAGKFRSGAYDGEVQYRLNG
jgi:hypothetical protein